MCSVWEIIKKKVKQFEANIIILKNIEFFVCSFAKGKQKSEILLLAAGIRFYAVDVIDPEKERILKETAKKKRAV